MMRPNILVCGFTGVGKTSLIQSVTKAGTVPDSAISDSVAATHGFVCYETDAAVFVDSEGLEPGQGMAAFIERISSEVERRLSLRCQDQVIHAIWYCIAGTQDRIQPSDKTFIREFSDKVLLVVTKTEDMREKQFKSLSAELSGLVAHERVVFVSGHKQTGLGQLIQATKNVAMRSMQESGHEIMCYEQKWQVYFAEKVAEVKDRCAQEADSYINWAAGRAAAVAINPFPLADLPVLAANEVYMIYKIGSAYGYSVDSTMIAGILGAAGASFAGKLLASFLPGVKIAVAAATTYGVGKAAKCYFESGMTLDEKALKRQFELAKKDGQAIKWEPVEEN